MRGVSNAISGRQLAVICAISLSVNNDRHVQRRKAVISTIYYFPEYDEDNQCRHIIKAQEEGPGTRFQADVNRSWPAGCPARQTAVRWLIRFGLFGMLCLLFTARNRVFVRFLYWRDFLILTSGSALQVSYNCCRILSM